MENAKFLIIYGDGLTKKMEIHDNQIQNLFIIFFKLMENSMFKKDCAMKNSINYFTDFLIKSQYPSQNAYKLRDSIFKDIPDESYFVIFLWKEVFKDNVEIRKFIHNSISYISIRNKGVDEVNACKMIGNSEFNIKECGVEEISNIYDLIVKPSTDKKDYIGEKNKKSRICRFCGLKEGKISSLGRKITFNKIAHAISEGLGNKLIILNEECDECNERFGVKEKNLIDFLDFYRIYYGTKGKNGEVKISTKNLNIERVKKSKFGLLDEIIDAEKQQEHITVITSPLVNCNNFINEGELELPNKFIPLEIYKTLVKYFLSVKEIKNNEDIELIEWINDKKNYEKVPNTLVFLNNEILKQPTLAIFTLKNSGMEKNYPKCVCELRVINLIFVYFLPNEMVNYNEFLDLFKVYSKMQFYKMFNFSSKELQSLKITFEIENKGIDV